jgi:cell filamentation protein
MSDYFTDSEDVIRNKLGISDPDELRAVEARISYIRQIEIESEPVPSRFDFPLLKRIHKRLFEDIYSFAGKIRVVDITKGPIPFCYVQHIDSEQRRIFEELKKEEFLANHDFKSFIEKVTYFASELNALHPFREGNGRTIRLFLRLLARHAGYQIQYDQCGQDELLQADIAAFSGNQKLLLLVYSRIIVAL